MMKALLVVVTMTGAEYNVNMPEYEDVHGTSKSCFIARNGSELRLFVSLAQMRVQEVREVFSLFGNMIQQMQEETDDEFGSPYSKCKNGSATIV